MVGVSCYTVAEYLRRAGVVGITWPVPAELDDAAPERRLFSPPLAAGEPPGGSPAGRAYTPSCGESARLCSGIGRSESDSAIRAMSCSLYILSHRHGAGKPIAAASVGRLLGRELGADAADQRAAVWSPPDPESSLSPITRRPDRVSIRRQIGRREVQQPRRIMQHDACAMRLHPQHAQHGEGA